MAATITFIDGFENAPILSTESGLWDYTDGNTGSYCQSSEKKTGTYAAHLDGKIGKSCTATDTKLVKVSCYGYSGGMSPISFRNTAANYAIEIVWDEGTQRFNVYIAGMSNPVVTGTHTFSMHNAWHDVEAYILIANSGGRVIVRIDGVEEINYTGDTLGTYSQIDYVVIGGGGHYDDVVIADPTADTDIIGDVRVVGIAPDGEGASEQWTKSSYTHNYECVNEVPPSDAQYNYTNTADQIDMLALASMPAGYAAIKGVQLSVRAVKAGSPTPQNIEIGIRPGTTNRFSGSNFAVSTTAKFTSKLWLTNPDTSNPWQESEVNALQAGYASRT